MMVYALPPNYAGTGGVFTGYLPMGIPGGTDAEDNQNTGVNYEIILASSTVRQSSSRIKCVPKYTIDLDNPTSVLMHGEACVCVLITEATSGSNLTHPAILVCTYSDYPKVRYSGITIDGQYTIYYEVTQSAGPPRTSMTMTAINEVVSESEIDAIFTE